MPKKTINWTRAKQAMLKAAIAEAEEENACGFALIFEPEGRCEFLLGYARYLDEYIDQTLTAMERAKPGRN